MRRAMAALPRNVHEGPRTEERQALLCHLPPRKPKSWRIDSDTRSEERHTSPPRPQKGSALPRLSISRERAGESRGVRRANAPALPRKVHEGPRTGERQALLCHLLPRKPKSWRIDSDTRSEERHTSPPRPQKGSALPRLSISRERAGESRGVRRADRPLLPRMVHDCPRTEERQALLCHLPPRKPKSWRIDSDTRSKERHMSSPRPQKGSSLPRLSISMEIPGESRGVRRADGTLLPRTVLDCPRRGERQALLTHLPPALENRSRGGSIPTPVPRSDTRPHLGPRRAALCQEGARGPQDRGATGPSLSPPPLENRSRGGSIPTPVPRSDTRPHLGPRRAALCRDFHFRGNELRRGVERREKGNAPALPRKVHEGPRTEERRALLCHLPPSKTEVAAECCRHLPR